MKRALIPVGAAMLALAATAHSQISLQEALPDLVVSKIALECDRVRVTVRNDGGRLLGSTPIIVRLAAIVIERGATTVEQPLPVTSLGVGSTSTVVLNLAGAVNFEGWSAEADVTNVIRESNENNNMRNFVVRNGDEVLCPAVTISDARGPETGSVIFTVSLNRPPLPNQPVSLQFATATGGSEGNARSGTACSALSNKSPVDFIATSGRLQLTSTTPVTIQVTACPDLVEEQDETFTVMLSNLVNVDFRNSRTRARGTIENVPAPSLR